MKLGFVASVFIMGSAITAVAGAPSALAAVPVTGTESGSNTTTYQRPGHINIKVTPPLVSDARSYGDASTPADILGE